DRPRNAGRREGGGCGLPGLTASSVFEASGPRRTTVSGWYAAIQRSSTDRIPRVRRACGAARHVLGYLLRMENARARGGVGPRERRCVRCGEGLGGLGYREGG